jgi:hypothetical protein
MSALLEAWLLQQVADEFDMPIGEVHRLAMIFTIFEIDPLKKHGGVFVHQKINGFGFLHQVPPSDAICDLRYAWKLASEDSQIAQRLVRELRRKKRLDHEDVGLWLEVLANQFAWSSFWSVRRPGSQQRREGFAL